MNRRTFTATLAGLLAVPASSPRPVPSGSLRRYALCPYAGVGSMLLEAVVAPRLPGSLTLAESEAGDLAGPTVDARPLPALFELRTYAMDQPVLDALSAAGVEPWLAGPRSFLIPFESFSHREQVWRNATAQRAWGAYTFQIYRPLPALRTT